MKRTLSLMAALAAAVMICNAVPAKRVYRTYNLADGTTVTAMKVGDEFGHYYVSEAGERFRLADKGCLERMSDDAVAVVERRAQNLRSQRSYNLASAEKTSSSIYHGLGHFSAAYPRKGKIKSIVFLVEYTDVKFKTPSPKEYFTRQLNEKGFSENGALGSARDYFLEQSQGTFDPDFEVYGPIQLSHKMSYYGGNDDANAHLMIVEAAEALDDQIDFSQYDFDGDGCIDNVFAIYAGYGEADYDDENTVWPHAWELYMDKYMFDGKRLYGYACANELTPIGYKTYPNGIATFCHEFSHVLGLPDLYNTNSSSDTTTPDAWDLMDYGSYNNDGRTPPNYSAAERNAMGWMYPAEFDGPANITLEPIHTSNTAYIIPTGLPNEFFVVENRQQEGWDEYLPGHGMVIWHINFDQNVWDNNTPNNIKNKHRWDLVEAGGIANSSYDNNGKPRYLASYPFPGTYGVTSFTSTTTPALKTWSGKAIDYPITAIEETKDGMIKFLVSGGVSSSLEEESLVGQEVRVHGRTAIYKGNSGDVLRIYDTLGTIVATATADSAGMANVDIPSQGLYIITTPEHSVKVMAK